MNAFEKFIINKYDEHQRHDIMVHGVANYAPHGLIYYSETEALYKVYKDDLHEIMGEYKQEMGEFPSYVVDQLDNATMFMNNLVWFCAEWVCGKYYDNPELDLAHA